MDAANTITAIEDTGYAIVADVIPADFCDAIIDEIQRLETLGPPALAANEFTGFETLRYFDLLNQQDIWQRVATMPFILEVIRGVLGRDMLLSTMGTAVIGPGETAQAIHCDDQLYGIARPHKNLVCNTMWALSDFTAANGATHLVPGSHQYPQDPTGVGRHATIQAEMPKGSICFVVGTTWHGGGANVTDSRRWALTINYCAASQRQQENLMLAHSREKLASFPAELQALVGLRVSDYGVGHINAGEPAQILP